MLFDFQPIGYVRGGRQEPVDDAWGNVTATIELDSRQFTGEALLGLSDFSHLLVIYFFHRVPIEKIEWAARHPRNNPAWPKVGIFAQRGKNRPNLLGVSVCKLLSVQALTIQVQGLDAIDGSPVLDLKPCLSGFSPREAVQEPEWAKALMADYW